MAGCHFAPLTYPLILVSFGDASRCGTNTLYPQEGTAGCLVVGSMRCNRVREDLVHPGGTRIHDWRSLPLAI
eukprot:5566708-Pyramimonas_sp.AAC.1